MTVKILDGNEVSNQIYKDLKVKYDKLQEKIGRRAGLAFIQVGNDSASRVYLNNKSKKCESMGIYQETYFLPEDITETELFEKIDQLNKDEKIDGILVQLPLPKHIDYNNVLSKIDINKDVDVFNPYNVGKVVVNDTGIYPCTPQGIIKLLKYYNIEIKGKDVVIIGRSNIVGKPLCLMMINEGATVQICNSLTKNLKEKTKLADILIVAAGVPKLINSNDIKEDSVVVDVGINVVDGKICGDVDFNDIIQSGKCSYISPVPKGVGPMTICSLIENTIRLYAINSKTCKHCIDMLEY